MLNMEGIVLEEVLEAEAVVSVSDRAFLSVAAALLVAKDRKLNVSDTSDRERSWVLRQGGERSWPRRLDFATKGEEQRVDNP